MNNYPTPSSSMAMLFPQLQQNSRRSLPKNPWDRIRHILSHSQSIKINDQVHLSYSQSPFNTLVLDLQFEIFLRHPLYKVQADLTTISTPAFSSASASGKVGMANRTLRFWPFCYNISQQSSAVAAPGLAMPIRNFLVDSACSYASELTGYTPQSSYTDRMSPVYSPSSYQRTIPPNTAALLNASDRSAPPDGDKGASSRSKLQLKTLRADRKHPPQRPKPCPPLKPLKPCDPAPTKQKKD